MRVFVDMDGVIADFEGGFFKIWRKLYPEEYYTPLDKRTNPHIVDDYPERLKDLIHQIYYSNDFIINLTPIQGSIEALHEMREKGIEIFICSSPFTEYKNCVLAKYEWVDKNFGRDWIKNLILLKDKTVIKADILIDDMPEIKGSETVPSWDHVLYDQPYNRNVKKKRLKNWEAWETILYKQ